MAGFRKATTQQGALKMGLYGPPGSGKTFTSLLIAEGLAKLSGKRIAVIDTEYSSTFYCQSVPERMVHPEAFDFDVLYTRAIVETTQAIKGLPADQYGVVILDSITHLWQACMEAYGGKQTSIGTIPMHAWGKIKRPYKDLISFLLSSPMHVIICGRQGVEYATNEETDELQAIGVKMKAEGETPYEPHILLRMEAIKPKKTNEVATIVAYAEKDRTGILAGRCFTNPTFDSLCRPLLGLLGATQAQMQSLDEAAAADAEGMAEQEADRATRSATLLREWSARVALAADGKRLKDVGKEITPLIKAQMTPGDVATLREAYQQREKELPMDGQPAMPESPPQPAPRGPTSEPKQVQPVDTGAILEVVELAQAADLTYDEALTRMEKTSVNLFKKSVADLDTKTRKTLLSVVKHALSEQQKAKDKAEMVPAMD